MNSLSKFDGTEQDLENLMREVLPKYINNDNDNFKLDIDKMQDKQKQENVLEAIAECVYRGYIENLKVLRSIEGNVTLTHFNTGTGISDLHPVSLTNAGKAFLDNN